MTKSIYSKTYRTLQRLLIDGRKEAELTQAQLGRKLNKPQSFVSKVETGERRLDVVELLAYLQGIGYDPVRLLRSLQRTR